MLPSAEAVREQWSAGHPGLDTAAMEIIGLLKAITGEIARAVEPLYEGAPLTAPEVDLLVPLRYMDAPVIARRLAENRRMSRAGISKALAKLEKRGFIARTPGTADRRTSLISVTEDGKAAVDALFPRQVEVESRLLAALGEDRQRVVDALTLLASALEQQG